MIDPHESETVYFYLDGTLSARDLGAFEAHLLACPDCAERLGELREMTDLMRDPETWRLVDLLAAKPTPDAGKVAELVALSDRIDEEQVAAAPLLPKLLVYARSHPTPPPVFPVEWRTCGTVQMLLEASESRRDQLPGDALTLARLASQIAMCVPIEHYHVRYVMQLRGEAWRAYGDLLRHVGDFPAALDALEEADLHYSDSPVGAFDLAIVHFIRAGVLGNFGQTDEALALLRKAAPVFEECGDIRRFGQTRMREANLWFERGDPARARTLLEPLVMLFLREQLPDALARTYANLGAFALELRDFPAASMYYAQALPLFGELGMETEQIRVRWNLARLLLMTGRTAEALPKLEAVQDAFFAHGIRGDAGLVALDRAEALLILDRAAEVHGLVQDAAALFLASGATAPAMTAIAYLKAAASSGAATPAAVQHVRTFLERLPQHPNEPFAPPPIPPS